MNVFRTLSLTQINTDVADGNEGDKKEKKKLVRELRSHSKYTS